MRTYLVTRKMSWQQFESALQGAWQLFWHLRGVGGASCTPVSIPVWQKLSRGAGDVVEEQFGFGIRRAELASWVCPKPESHHEPSLLAASCHVCRGANSSAFPHFVHAYGRAFVL